MGAMGATKLAEHHLRIEETQYGLPTRTLRLSNPYGECAATLGVQGVIAVFDQGPLRGAAVHVGRWTGVRGLYLPQTLAGRLLPPCSMRAKPVSLTSAVGSGHSGNDIVHTLERLLGHAVERLSTPLAA